MNKKAKTKSKPKQEETKTAPTQEAPKTNKLKYEKGNGELLLVELLVLVCNKLDEMRNHTAVMVEQNDEIIKLLTKDDVGDI